MTTILSFDHPAMRAWQFAHQHDWGRIAGVKWQDGRWWITKLIDAYTRDGLYHEELVMVEASIEALREFGNY